MKETIKRLYEHFKKVEKEGSGSDNPVKEQLVKSDAKKNREELEAKHSFLTQTNSKKSK